MKKNDFLVIQSTPLSVQDVLDKIEAILKEKGVAIFARINHGRAASEANLTMQEEEVLVFGNPKVGTALMLDQPEIGIELPLKVLVWRATDKTMVAYQNLEKLADIFEIKTAMNTINLLKGFMENLIKSAIK